MDRNIETDPADTAPSRFHRWARVVRATASAVPHGKPAKQQCSNVPYRWERRCQGGKRGVALLLSINLRPRLRPCRTSSPGSGRPATEGFRAEVSESRVHALSFDRLLAAYVKCTQNWGCGRCVQASRQAAHHSTGPGSSCIPTCVACFGAASTKDQP